MATPHDNPSPSMGSNKDSDGAERMFSRPVPREMLGDGSPHVGKREATITAASSRDLHDSAMKKENSHHTSLSSKRLKVTSSDPNVVTISYIPPYPNNGAEEIKVAVVSEATAKKNPAEPGKPTNQVTGIDRFPEYFKSAAIGCSMTAANANDAGDTEKTINLTAGLPPVQNTSGSEEMSNQNYESRTFDSTGKKDDLDPSFVAFLAEGFKGTPGRSLLDHSQQLSAVTESRKPFKSGKDVVGLNGTEIRHFSLHSFGHEENVENGRVKTVASEVAIIFEGLSLLDNCVNSNPLLFDVVDDISSVGSRSF